MMIVNRVPYCRLKEECYVGSYPIMLGSLIVLMNLGGKTLSAFTALHSHIIHYWDNRTITLVCSVLQLVLLALTLGLPRLLHEPRIAAPLWKAIVLSGLITIVGSFLCDLLYLYASVLSQGRYADFAVRLQEYFQQEQWFYGYQGILIAFTLGTYRLLYRDHQNPATLYVKIVSIIAAIFLPVVSVQVVALLNLKLFWVLYAPYFSALPASVTLILNIIDAAGSVMLLTIVTLKRVQHSLSYAWLMMLCQCIALMTLFSLLTSPLYELIALKHLVVQCQLLPADFSAQFISSMQHQALSVIPLILLLLIATFSRSVFKHQQFQEDSPTSGQFGSAAFATEQDLVRLQAYSPQTGIPVGCDEKGRILYLPLCNKLTLSPPGGGKTTSSTIIALLTHDAPAFVFDIKGELWAVTARYRSEVLGRTVVTIDPFGITKSPAFSAGKSQGLLKEYRLNPFDWVPQARGARDRMMNAFAASFVIDEGSVAKHFDENAKILIRGYIDYLMNQDPSERTLSRLYELMSEHYDDAEGTFAEMAHLEGRAKAAANQIHRVGSDERGSILSTSYRQIDWMGDSNLQASLSESNFDLRDFLKGNTDLFIVLPEDQVKEHSRLVRMILALLMGIMVQANPRELPPNKMLFLLDELAQLGYCPDVEQAIEVLRARQVVVWTVFQTLSQIELFQKPDLFKGAPLKQIFTNDDTKTMEWIQTLGGKKTVLTKTLSNNQGDSGHRLATFRGQVSHGEGESIHETATDLIPLNELRELSRDEQLIFYHGARPIRCRKLRYFEHPLFRGRFDPNPLEANPP